MPAMPGPKPKILLVRNDKLGDFMLAFPAFAQLRRNLPQAELHALVPEYTRPLAEACPSLDRVLVDPGPKHGIRVLARRLREQNYDAVITLYSTTRVGLAAWLARIPERVAPATKLAQLFYNKRLTQHRSRSEKPEHAYNRDLVNYYLLLHGQRPVPLPDQPYLHFEENRVSELETTFRQRHGIEPEARLVFVHPGSGGSAANLAPDQFARLARALHSPHPLHIVVSCGPGEEEPAREVARRLGDACAHSFYLSDAGLRRFAEHIQFADLFISGSTGPLHIAGALDRPTAGFYTRRRSAIALRWQTLNSEDRRLAFSPPQDAEEEDMRSIDVDNAAKRISEKFLS